MFGNLLQFSVTLHEEIGEAFALVEITQVREIDVFPILRVAVLFTVEVESVIKSQLLEALLQLLCGAVSFLVVRLVHELLFLALFGKLFWVAVDVSLFLLVERHFSALLLYAAILRFDDVLFLDVGRGLEGEGVRGHLEGGEIDDCVVPLRQQELMRDIVKIPDALLADVGSGVLELGDDPGVGGLEGGEQVALGVNLAFPPVLH